MPTGRKVKSRLVCPSNSLYTPFMNKVLIKTLFLCICITAFACSQLVPWKERSYPRSPKDTVITLAACGDLMFHGPQIRAALNNKTGNYDFAPSFKLVKKYISQADVAVGNFEVVTAGTGYPFRGYPAFNSPDSVLTTLKVCGFDLLWTANNHCLDYGLRGLRRTGRLIKKQGIDCIGTKQEGRSSILLRRVRGVKLAFLAYTYGINGLGEMKNKKQLLSYINIISTNHIKRDIRRAKKLGSELVIVSLHWGKEYLQQVSPEQQSLARAMFSWGADIILGSHPHVIQKAERFRYRGRDKYVIYSMGNFISNMSKKTVGNSLTEDGVLVQFRLRRLADSGKLIIEQVSYIPTWVQRVNKGNGYSFTIIPVDEFLKKKNLAGKLRKRLLRSRQNTIDMIIH